MTWLTRKCVDVIHVVSDIVKGSRSRYGSVLGDIKSREGSITCNFMSDGRSVNVEPHSLARFSFFRLRGACVVYSIPGSNLHPTNYDI